MEVPEDVKLIKGMLFPTYDDWCNMFIKHQNFFRQVYEMASANPLPTKKVRKVIDLRLGYYDIYYECKFGSGRSQSKATGLRQSR